MNAKSDLTDGAPLDVECADQDFQLAEILEKYLADLERGAAPDRQTLLARHPGLSVQLASCLDSLDVAQRMSIQFREDAARGAMESSARVPTQLGDFRIVREIGRGGMGIVFEAEQLSMGRLVALKILPLAALMDPKGLARFKNEVRAAGTLDHPHIIQVYSVGEERGVHYFAMQLIRGRSIARVIEQLQLIQPQRGAGSITAAVRDSAEHSDQAGSSADPTSVSVGVDQAQQADVSTWVARDGETAPERKPSYSDFCRSVAQLGVQAAEALHHAHERGIVHRDVKPGNLLVDGAGGLWVTDFGLARIEADARLTLSRDWVGTLRYMAPEQALGHKAQVDHRVDIYSLGATLHELLILRPARDGDDQEEMLKQCAASQPVPLRKIDPRIPTELATIVGKAMEFEPSDRYATAQAMADDLGRFLRSEPIEARPPSVLDRGAKWIRRHAGLAASLVVLLVTATLCLATSSILVGSALNRTRSAQAQTLRERDAAFYHLYVANVRLAKEEWENGNLGAVHSLLDDFLPVAGQTDFRGWEWHYLDSLLHRDIATLRGHSSAVSTVDWSPDGQHVLTAGDDCTLKIWDVANERVVTTFLGHTELVWSAAWSPDGRFVASASWDKTVRVWDAVTGETTLKIAAGKELMRGVAWSPDSTKLASCGNDDSPVKVWDAQTGEELVQMESHFGGVWSVAWSPDGTRLASVGNSSDLSIRIWDAVTGKQIKEILGAHRHTIDCVAWSPNGRRLATASRDQLLKVWDADAGQELWRADAHHNNVSSVSWSPDGSLLASGGSDGAVRLWNAERGNELRILRGHTGSVLSVAWRADGKRLASASSDGTAKVWDPDQDQTSTCAGGSGGADWSPDGRYLAVGASGDSSIKIVDAATLAVVNRYPILLPDGGRIGPIAWSRNGKRIAYSVGGTDIKMTINVMEHPGGNAVTSFADPHRKWNEVWAVAWSPDATLLGAAMMGIPFMSGGFVVVWDTLKNEEVARLSHDDRPPMESLAWSPDGARLATASWDQKATIWDTTTWREILKLDRYPSYQGIYAGGEQMIAWTRDGTSLAAGSQKGWGIVWNVTTGRETLSFSAHAGPVQSIAFSPDATRIVTCGNDRTMKIWDAATGAQLLTLRSAGAFGSVKWSPDGTRLLSRGNGIRVWDGSPRERDAP